MCKRNLAATNVNLLAGAHSLPVFQEAAIRTQLECVFPPCAPSRKRAARNRQLQKSAFSSRQAATHRQPRICAPSSRGCAEGVQLRACAASTHLLEGASRGCAYKGGAYKGHRIGRPIYRHPVCKGCAGTGMCRQQAGSMHTACNAHLLAPSRKECACSVHVQVQAGSRQGVGRWCACIRNTCACRHHQAACNMHLLEGARRKASVMCMIRHCMCMCTQLVGNVYAGRRQVIGRMRNTYATHVQFMRKLLESCRLIAHLRPSLLSELKKFQTKNLQLLPQNTRPSLDSNPQIRKGIT